MENELKTGTTTLGIVTKDGVVLAADRRATAGNLIVSKNVEKVLKISDSLVVTTAGSVSEIQLLVKLIKAELQLKRLRTNREPTTQEAANMLGSMVYRNVRSFGMASHFIIAGKDNKGYHVYDIFPDGSVNKIEDFLGTGSGSVFAYGLLESAYKKDLSLEEAKDLAIKAINSAMQRDNASGNGITLYTITEKGVQKELNKEVTMDVTK